jgi:hypothetical protein
MKRFILCVLLASAISVSVFPAMADGVYDRSVVTISTTAGTAIFTNTAPYVALELKRIWIARSLAATDTQTITRITSGGAYTQAVGSVTIATSAGSTASFTAAYLKYGDMLNFAGTATTGSVAIIEYEVQKP